MTRLRAIIFATLGVFVLLAGSGLAYYQFATTWQGPSLSIRDTDPGFRTAECWEVTWVMERGRLYVRTVEKGGPVLETRILTWDQIQVYLMPEHLPKAHGQTGTVDVGDIACTSSRSQEWIYLPTGEQVTGYCFTPEWTTCRAAGGTE